MTHFKHIHDNNNNNDMNWAAFSKKYQCEDCCTTFNNAKALRKHIDTCHHTVKSFVCLYCQKKFSRRDGLQIHYQTHLFGKDERKTFQCETCGSKFTHKCNLQKHLRNFKKIHGDKKKKITVLWHLFTFERIEHHFRLLFCFFFAFVVGTAWITLFQKKKLISLAKFKKMMSTNFYIYHNTFEKYLME
ncbi:hypothetical protein RFI_02996 [Reticulomyxa filosa]|uniref:C2H2-type domain-containing protein n=1 Tax=Reticulomyxa filosa TaxID=46433 RepID=X6P7K2_RETFI|nr:hypothetical protein RFI_02996 [Reticulomyxa filosa]|eukprot:ETO34098.1 hypothetical protein RFI_02996 [Reticulomyxa filosa]